MVQTFRMADEWSRGVLHPPSNMGLATGEVLAGRFALGALAGRGGMGAVYAGKDLLTGAKVAIKVATSERSSRSRFWQEVAVLSRLSHPAIVRYVDAGRAPSGCVYLVMEWLEGETLGARLARERMTTAQALSVLRQSCEALAVAHEAGIVHRDLKPGNLFLVDGALDRIKVIDFGIARHHDGERTVTQTGVVLGTCGYMAPEQALGFRDVDARADVFALGCMFFECLVGRAAFTGTHAVAVMAKVLHEEPPALRSVRTELGEPLGALLARMLSKDRAHRPVDARAVLREVGALGSIEHARTSEQVAEGLTDSEHRVVSVVLGRPRTQSDGQVSLTSETVDDSVNWDQVEQITQSLGCKPVFLRGGALMVVLSDHGAVTDQTAQAARCALRLRAARPDLLLSVATGRAVTAGQVPIGAAVDQAADLLAGAAPEDGIVVDRLTASLLEQGFVLEREADQVCVVRERSEQRGTRPLLGKPTPFVGRDKELWLLKSTLAECIEDSVARVAVVLGAPGQGKSRLRHELMAQVRSADSARILIARADPVGAGSALLLVRQLVRRAIGLQGGDPAGQQYEALCEHVDALGPAPDANRLAEFLGELIGAPSPHKPSPELRAARNDPQIMSGWLRRTFIQWLGAECDRSPLLIVLEDLHWGDAASVLYLGEALRALASQPLMVLALARPEIQDTFPKLWASAEPQLLQLSRLTPRAAQRLIRAVLGPQLSDAAEKSLVQRADGNPFHLEELIRRVAAGTDDESLPETVVALVQTRLQRLDAVARRSARAASLFGESFWVGGMTEVLGAVTPPQDVSYSIGRLMDEELIIPSDESRFSGEREYTFRHGLLREAAYSMLTESDRKSGHVLAGQWLESVGETDALTLAQHFEFGGQPERAVPWLLAAAQSAADGGNVQDATALARRGLDSGAEGVTRGRLHLVQAEASIMRAEWRDVVVASYEAADCLPPGSAAWFKAAAGPLLAGTFMGDMNLTQQAVRTVMSSPLNDEVTGPYGLSLFWVCQALLNVSDMQSAEGIMQRAEALAASSPDADPMFRMWLRIGRSFAQMLKGDLGAIEVLDDARKLAERTGAAFARAFATMYAVAAYSQTGDAASTSAAADLARKASEPTGLHLSNGWATYFHALVYARAQTPKQELYDRAIHPLRELCERGDRRLAVTAQNLLAMALHQAGETNEASRLARAATEDALLRQELATTLAVRAHIELALGQADVALEQADRGLEAATGAIFPWTGSLLRVSRARALYALGRTRDAHAAIAVARDAVLRIASTIAQPNLRRSFLTNIDANAQALTLAEAWLGPEAAGGHSAQ